jgi:imidazoleglycerol-phosphate dehydratase
VTTGRVGEVRRTTNETSIEVRVDLDGRGDRDVATGMPFFDHMLDQLARHGGFDLIVRCQGDLAVDSHHSVEDVALAIGEALRIAWGDKRGVRRFASGLFPLDEALVEVALDLSGRPFAAIELPVGYADGMPALALGDPPFNPELAEHFFASLATAAAITLHVTRRSGRNTHHVVEAAFKGVARCLRDAVRVESDGVPSTKGTL